MNAPALEVHLDADDLDRTLRSDVLTGLTAEPKWLPPKWFYDARGSELFEDITKLPEYYPPRAERAILLYQRARPQEANELAAQIASSRGLGMPWPAKSFAIHASIARVVHVSVMRVARAQGERLIFIFGAKPACASVWRAS